MCGAGATVEQAEPQVNEATHGYAAFVDDADQQPELLARIPRRHREQRLGGPSRTAGASRATGARTRSAAVATPRARQGSGSTLSEFQ